MPRLVPLLIGCAATVLLQFTPMASADVTIIGALSNFDCPNQTPEVCDEFEIEFEGPHPEDVLHTWGNYNYGPPTVAANGTGSGVLINYKRAGHTTPIGAIEHFGVTLPNFNMITARTFRWKHNGVIVTSGAGQPPVPIPVSNIGPTGDSLVEAIENEQPEESIWVRRSTIVVPREVDLSELMPDDPLVTASTPIEVDLERLGPGETLESAEDVNPEDTIQTVIIVIETHADIATWNPALQAFDHAPGDLLSRAMNGTVIQARACSFIPSVALDPVDVAAPVDGGADFSALADAPPGGGQLHYQWRREGVDMIGEDQPNLNIDPVTEADAGAYYCVISNDCGLVITQAARLSVIVPPLECNGDANADLVINFADVTSVLSNFGTSYEGTPFGTGPGDADHDGRVDFGDITRVLSRWGGSCV